MSLVVSPVTILICLNCTSSSSATIWLRAVATPVPRSTLPENTVTRPSRPTAIHESSEAACRSPARSGPALSCGKISETGPKRLKLTTSAPLPLRTSLRESFVFIFSSLRLHTGSGGALYCANHAQVAAATAEVSIQGLLDLIVVRMGILIEENLRNHDHSVHA